MNTRCCFTVPCQQNKTHQVNTRCCFTVPCQQNRTHQVNTRCCFTVPCQQNRTHQVNTRCCFTVPCQQNRTHQEGRKEMFYLTTHSTHFIYSYMASYIWLRTILIVRKKTRCCHIGYSFRLTARVLLYAPSHRQDSTYHSLCYTSRGALAGTRNSSMGPPHEGSIRRPIAP